MKIRVPGTTANLGPGFDALGLALTCYSYLEVEPVTEDEFDKDNLIHKAFIYFFNEVNEPVPAMRLTLEGDIPRSRGLGSSAACIVGGLTVANIISGKHLPKEDLLTMATALEGHPDNVAPCLLGGLISASKEGDKILTARFDIHPDWNFYTAIPNFEMSTADARNVLPRRIPFQDGVFNLSRIPLLLKGLENGDTDLLRAGTEDRLAEPYRGVLIPEYEKVKGFGLKYGGAMISGAGPTVLMITKENLDMMEWETFMSNSPYHWELYKYEPDLEGARPV